MSDINIKITNAKQLIAVLKDIRTRAENCAGDYSAHTVYEESLNTLIKVLEEAK